MPNSSSHFLINWHGNKRMEYNHIKHFITIENKLNIVEPFCGTCAISFNIWLEHGNKFNYYLNDLDEDLIKVIHFQKNQDLNEFVVKLNDEKKKYFNLDLLNGLYNDWIQNKDVFKYIILKKLTFNSFKQVKLYNYRKNNSYETTTKINKLQIKFQEFLRSSNVFITNDDWFDCYNRHKDDTQSLIIFDPPYLDSDNSTYIKNNNLLNVYDKLNDIKNDSASSIFILEKVDKVEELFKDWNILTEYNKTYSIKLRKTTHILFLNH